MIQSRIRRCFSRIRRLFERSLSEGRIQQLGWILGFIFVIVLVCVLLAVAFLGFKWQDVLSLFLDPGGFGQKEEIGHYDLFRLLATIIGLFLFSALLISVVSNMFENIADSFKNGHSRYSHKGHVLILGGGHQLAGMLSALARDPQSKTKDIVVLTAQNVDALRNSLADHFDDEEGKNLRSRATLYFGERDNREDLATKDLARNAAEIFIIGDDNEPDHDSVSVKCCKLLKDICDDADHPIPCKLVLQDAASMDVFKFTGSVDRKVDKQTAEDGKKKKDMLLVDVIYDNEYIAEQILIPRSETDPAIDYCSIKKIPGDYGYRFQTIPGIREDSDRYVHLVIAGTTDMAVAMATTAAHICHFPNFKEGRNRTVITFVDTGMKGKMSRFVAAHENLFRLSHYRYLEFADDGSPRITPYAPVPEYGDFLDVRWEFADAHICSTEMAALLKEWAADGRQALSLAICLEKQTDNTFSATHLPFEIYEKGCPVFVHQHDKGDILLDAQKSGQFGNIHVFGSTSSIKGDSLYRHRIERGKHVNLVYRVRREKALGNEEYRTIQEDAAWYGSKEADKFSSIYCANALPIRNHSFGLEGLSPDSIEKMSGTLFETEHRRWMMSTLLLGYRALLPEKRTGLLDDHKKWLAIKNEPDAPSKSEFNKVKARDFLHACIAPNEMLKPYPFLDGDIVLLKQYSYIMGDAGLDRETV